MEAIGMGLMGFGALIFLIGALWFIIETFREGILWGIGCLLFGPLQLIFLIVHWKVAAKPFVLQLFGIVLMIGGSYLAPHVINQY